MAAAAPQIPEETSILVVMGVSGSGKTCVGRRIAELTERAFLDADEVHPDANVDKMRAGEALDDGDREPWLRALGERLEAWTAAGRGGVLACSALKRAYRETLRAGAPRLRLLYLKVAPEEARRRISRRRNHFMPASLNDSQFETLEEPDAAEGAVVVSSSGGVEATARRAVEALSDAAPRSAPQGADAPPGAGG